MDFSKHGDGTTSVKVHHAPGGKSNFSLAWDNGPQEQPVKKTQPVVNQPPVQSHQVQTNNQGGKALNVQTSVKVHNPPGGKSNFTLGWFIISFY